MRNIGVDSVPLVMIVAGFLGAVTAFQAFYQLFAGVQLSVLGLLVRGSIVLELGPLLTALVLTGRVGARMTAEIGTMRVTEQIDALETLAYDPIAFLVVPRLLAALVMLPILTIIANATAIVSAWLTLIIATTRDDERLRDGPAAQLRAVPGRLQRDQGRVLRRRDRDRLLVRGLRYRRGRRGRRAVDGEGGGHRVDVDSRARRDRRGGVRAVHCANADIPRC